MLPLSDSENRTTTVPYVNQLLIAANIAAFVAQTIFLTDGPANQHQLPFSEFAVVPLRFIAHFSALQFSTLFSSMFMHAGIGHIVGNLWYLFIFGDNVEDRMGHTNYLFFYLTCGVLAGLAHILTNPGSTVSCIGASGAISGVLAAYLVLFPGAQVKTWVSWFWTPNVSAWLLIGFWFFMQLASAYLTATTTGGGTAFFAHIGGFVFGIILLKICLRRDANAPADIDDDRYLPMPFFVSMSLVLYGIAAIGFAMYKAHTLPFMNPPSPAAATAPAVVPRTATPKGTNHQGPVTEKKHSTSHHQKVSKKHHNTARNMHH